MIVRSVSGSPAAACKKRDQQKNSRFHSMAFTLVQLDRLRLRLAVKRIMPNNLCVGAYLQRGAMPVNVISVNSSATFQPNSQDRPRELVRWQ